MWHMSKKRTDGRRQAAARRELQIPLVVSVFNQTPAREDCQKREFPISFFIIVRLHLSSDVQYFHANLSLLSLQHR